MCQFRFEAARAYRAVCHCKTLYSDRKPIWAEMRDKYFNGRPYVYPDEMIEHLSEFNNEEIVAFLQYCSNYKERFCDGAYGRYAAEGFIGKLLVRLKELPLYITKDGKKDARE